MENSRSHFSNFLNLTGYYFMDNQTIRKKIIGGLLGKAVGGTLGAPPYEGCTGPLKLKFYDPVPDKMLPNDDLDLQILWACKLKDDWNGVLSCENFARAWVENVGFPWDEYGVAIKNIRLGIKGSAIGSYDNAFCDGMGAAIRSELWAFLAPGNPALAVKYASMDGCIDHCGSGLEAEIFLAALESMAFVESDVRKLIDCGASFLPAASYLKKLVRNTVKICRSTNSTLKIRKALREEYACHNFTDVHVNIAFMIAALLIGKGDFSKTICTAVNFGCDTDCTGATVGALLGIIDPDCIEDKWLKPIGHDLVVSKEITGINPPATLDEFADLVISLKDKITITDDSVWELPEEKYEISGTCRYATKLFAGDFRKFPVPKDGNIEEVAFSGNFVNVDFSKHQPDSYAIYEIDFEVKRAGAYKVLVSTTAGMRTWVDTKYCFGQEAGPFLPAFHRAPLNQSAVIELAAGKHTLAIGVTPNSDDMTEAPLLFGIGGMDDQYIPDAFYRPVLNNGK